jgi:hypothetical protein
VHTVGALQEQGQGGKGSHTHLDNLVVGGLRLNLRDRVHLCVLTGTARVIVRECSITPTINEGCTRSVKSATLCTVSYQQALWFDHRFHALLITRLISSRSPVWCDAWCG